MDACICAQPPLNRLKTGMGVTIASDELLRQAGHRHDMLPRSWQQTSYAYFRYDIGPRMLLTRRCDDTHLSSIERWDARRYGVDEVLSFHFGSTPISPQTYAHAMRLTMYFHNHEPPAGLRWINSPDRDLDSVSEFARMRRFDEHYARYQQARNNLRGFTQSLLQPYTC
jgi:hypothetical protein